MRKSILSIFLALTAALGLLVTIVVAASNTNTPDGMVTIQQIQFTTAPSGDSPLVGQTVTTTGIVYATYPGNGYSIAEAAGQWHGIYVYQPNGILPQIGDEVQVTGEVQEFFGMTELGNFATYTVLSSGNIPYAASSVNTGDIATGATTAESHEGTFVAVTNVTVTDDDLGFGEWLIDDGSGGARVNDMGDYSYTPTLSDTLYTVRGMLNYSFSDFKIEPRGDQDIILGPQVTLSKVAPANIPSGDIFTYTLTVDNTLGFALTNLTVTDIVPSNSTFAYALDGGMFGGGQVTWTIPSLPDQASASVRFVVTATGALNSLISNNTYSVTASNYTTPTNGSPVLTVIGDYTPIPIIQGTDSLSGFRNQVVETEGIVTGFFEGNLPSGGGVFNGFFIQDEVGDSNSATSDGIYVNHSTLNINVNVGDKVRVMGTVQEFIEYDGASCPDDACMTMLRVVDTNDVTTIGSGSITPLIIDPPGDPTAALDYYESIEGMLVNLPMTATVTGPTSFGTIYVVPGDEGVDRVFRNSPQEGMVFAVRHYERFGDINGSDAPGLIVSSVVDDVDGPFMFSYGSFMVTTQDGDAWSVVSSAPEPPTLPSWPGPASDEFSVLSFNTLNFDAGGGSDKRTKVVDSIVQAGCPTFVALQEIDADDGTLMTALMNDLGSAGCAYDYFNSHTDVGGHGAAVIWRTDLVSNVTTSADYQACSPFGSSSSIAYDNFCDGVPGEFPLFSRRPVVVTGTVTLDGEPLEVVFIGNHFKSKLGGAPSDQRRLEQGQFVADLVSSFVASGSPHVIVAGDLNDFEDSPPLQALYSGGLVSGWNQAPAGSNYSYIFTASPKFSTTSSSPTASTTALLASMPSTSMPTSPSTPTTAILVLSCAPPTMTSSLPPSIAPSTPCSFPSSPVNELPRDKSQGIQIPHRAITTKVIPNKPKASISRRCWLFCFRPTKLLP